MIIQLTPPTILGKLSRLICMATSVLGISLTALPTTTLAAGADGNYRVTAGKGSISINGRTETIPKSVFDEITADQSNAMVVKGQKIKFNRNLSASIFQSLAEESGITLRAKITGPSSITLKPVGSAFIGKTASPIITKLTGVYRDEKVSATVKTNVDATVKANTLTLTTRFVAKLGGDKVSGVITLVGSR
jgi:hypothetical protein